MSKLNFCLVTFEFPPFHWMGGEGTYTAGLHNSLSKLGHNVTTLVTDLEMQTLPKTTRRSDVIFVPTLNIRLLRLLSFILRANSRIREIVKGNCAMDVIHYTNRFNPGVSGDAVREQWKLDSEPLIVFVGRLVRNKGLHVLFEAFMNLLKEARDAKLAIVGEETKPP